MYMSWNPENVIDKVIEITSCNLFYFQWEKWVHINVTARSTQLMVAEFTLRGLLVSAIVPSQYKLSLFQHIPGLRLWLVYIINKKFSQPLLWSQRWGQDFIGNQVPALTWSWLFHKLHKCFLKNQDRSSKECSLWNWILRAWSRCHNDL